jgi:hypothetical protein
MNHRVVATLSLALALVSSAALTGCCKGKSGSTGTTGTSGTTGELVTIPNAGVKFNAPGGWVQYPGGDWKRFKPSDSTARLAFVTFDRPGESTARIGQIAGQLDIGAVQWGSAHPSLIGPDKLKANIGDGKCKITGSTDECYVEYATVDTGKSTQLLIVYVVNLTKGAQNKANASAAIQSLSKM